MSPQQRAAVDSPGAWLTTVATRICLNLLGSARARRETYVGEWLPEPLPGPADQTGLSAAGADPADRVTLDESVSMAFLVVLDSMTPAERVAFVLHDVFGYPFTEVAEITGRTPAACRQLASSARRRVGGARTSAASVASVASVASATSAASSSTKSSRSSGTSASRRAGIVSDFKAAWEAKDIAALISLLDPDATAVADSGGLALSFLDPIEGAEHIARGWIEIANRAQPSMRLLERTVNGQPGLVAEHDGVVVTVFAFDIVDDRIRHIWVVRNPEKLRFWTGAARREHSTSQTIDWS
jgi:RNA polymerase sigma-70 factor (ECF subfamily)